MNIINIYLITIPIILGLAALLSGILKSKQMIHYVDEVMGPAMLVAAGWPLFLGIILIVAPFVGLYYFGIFIASKL